MDTIENKKEQFKHRRTLELTKQEKIAYATKIKELALSTKIMKAPTSFWIASILSIIVTISSIYIVGWSLYTNDMARTRIGIVFVIIALFFDISSLFTLKNTHLKNSIFASNFQNDIESLENEQLVEYFENLSTNDIVNFCSYTVLNAGEKEKMAKQFGLLLSLLDNNENNNENEE